MNPRDTNTHRATRRPTIWLCAFGLLVALGAFVPLAAAAEPEPEVIGGNPGGYPLESGPGGLASVSSLAASNRENGAVYLLDNGQTQRVSEFKPNGEFLRAFGWGIVPGAASGTGEVLGGSSVITHATTTNGEFMRNQLITGPGIPANDRIRRVLEGRIELTRPATASATSATLTVAAGPGNVPTNERQRLTVKATGGQLKLQFDSPLPDSSTATTSAIPATATHEELQSALEVLANIGEHNVSVTGGPGDATGTSPYLIEFKGRYADSNVRPLQVTEAALTGGSAESTLRTPTEGGGALETCTTVCTGEIREQPAPNGGETEPPTGSPGQNNWPDEIAVDNDPSSPTYGDVYVVDQRNYRVERYSPEGRFELVFGGEVDKGPHHPGNVCTAAYLTEGDSCGAGVPGSGPGFFTGISTFQGWNVDGSNSITVGPGGVVYVGDFRRIEEFSPEGPGGLAYQGQLELPSAQMISSLAVDAESHVYANSLASKNVQSATYPASGSFELCFKGQCTPPLTTAAGNEEIAEALETLSTIGERNVSVQAENRIRITFLGPLAHGEIPLLTDSAGTVEWSVHGAAAQLVKLAGPKAAEPSKVLVTYDEGGEPIHIAVDSQGDLFANDFTGGFVRPSCSFSEEESCPEARFRAFRPDGTLYAIFTSPRVIAASPNSVPLGLAFGASTGKLYASALLVHGGVPAYYVAVLTPPTTGSPIVKQDSEEASNLEPETAVLHAVVNPHGFDTHYEVEYITEAAFKANPPGEEFNGAVHAPLKDLGAVIQEDQVSVPLANLQPGTAYRWRVAAESHCHENSEICEAKGEAAEFSTLPPVSVSGLTTQTVGPELVTLKAQLNPNNGVGTEYTFRYGETKAYAAGSSRGTLPLGGEFKQVKATFTGLKPNTTYHYQLKVKNSYGEEESSDQTFTTELSSAEELAAEECSNGSHHGEPNSTIREEDNSLALPDCRAYEQVSENEQHGGQVAAQGIAAAPSGERAYYVSIGNFAGAEQDHIGGQYIAHRTESGWRTEPAVRNVGPPPAAVLGAVNFNPQLERWLLPVGSGFNDEESTEGSSAYFALGLGNGSFVSHASPVLAPLDGAPHPLYQFTTNSSAPTSEDLSRVFIPTNLRLLPEDERPDEEREGIPPGADRIYEVAGVGTASGSLRLAAEVPLGLKAGQETHCFIDPPFTLPSHYAAPRMTNRVGTTLFYTAPIEELAGYGCGEGTPNPYGLFSRTGDNPPVQLNAPPPSQCTPGHPCFDSTPTLPLYDGSSADGRRVWFTTEQPLINQDTDEANDLYVARLTESGELEELVLASAGEATETHPTPGEGAKVGEDGYSKAFDPDRGTNQGVVRVSEDGTHVAFESPAVLTEEPNLLGGSAVQHANNLYVYDLTTNKTKFVTELCSGPGRSGSEPGPVPQGDHGVGLAESVPDPACPADSVNSVTPGNAQGEFALWMLKDGESGNAERAAMTPDGRYFLFAGVGRFTPDKTSEAQAIFRYDFQTGELIRVSIGHRGNDNNGNDDAYPAEFPGPGVGGGGFFEPGTLGEDGGRAISEDGSVVIFRTAAPLVSRDTNQTSGIGSCEAQGEAEEKHTGCDIYEWEEDGHGTCTETGGCVSLISSGHAPFVGDRSAILSASGRDIFFQTDRGLVPNDTNGVGDVYDARVEGGFHPEHNQPPCTSPEACGEAATSPPASPVLGTPNFIGPGNAATQLECAKGHHRVDHHGKIVCAPDKPSSHRHHHSKHKHSHRRGGK